VQLGIGIGIGHAALVGGGGAAAPFVPTDITGNIIWLDSTLGIALGGTMRAGGTTPPVVTISSSTSLTQSTSLEFDMPVGGTLGVAQFRYKVNGGSFSANTPTAAAVAIPGTDITAAFPAGTYSTNNTYKTTVATWADQNAATNDVAQATAASQPLYVYSSVFGCNVVEFSVGLRLAKTTGVLTGDATHSMWARVRLTTTATANQGFCAVGSTNTTNLISHIGINGSNVLNSGTSSTQTPTGSTLVNGTVYSVGKVHTLGADDQGYLAGATDGSALARTYTLSAGLVVGGRANAASGQAPHQCRKVAMYSVDPTASEKTALHTWLST
jgi:hypothetical protein